MALLRMLWRLLSLFSTRNDPFRETTKPKIKEPALTSGFLSSYSIDEHWPEGISRGRKNMSDLKLYARLSACFAIKNESAVIEKSLDALVGLADEIVIVDTGSTDDTLVKIAAWEITHGYRGRVSVYAVGSKFHDQDGDFDFGAAKAYASEMAVGDYILWLDGADVVQSPAELRQEFEYNVRRHQHFVITCNTKSGGMSFPRERIYPSGSMRWVGRVHETLAPIRKMLNIRSHVEIEHQKKERKGSHLERNLRILMKEWKANSEDSRTCMYIANSYFDMGEFDQSNYDKCIPWYERRVYGYSYTDFPEETFKAMEYLAKIYLFRKDVASLEKWACEMLGVDSKRREGYYYRMCAARLRGDIAGARDYMTRCLSYSRRPDFLYWTDANIYDDAEVMKVIS